MFGQCKTQKAGRGMGLDGDRGGAMRLICPNCDAEYEVDGEAIPLGGRDVQCSNCGHAWFQLPPEVIAAREDEAHLYDPGPGMATPEALASPAPASGDADEDEAPPALPEVPSAVLPEAAGGMAPSSGRSLDENLMAVLREEAERETNARKAEAAALETQTEMPLTGAPGPATAAARKISRLRGEPDPPPKPPEPARPRRDLLPEIEEINSSLRAAGEKREVDQGAVADTMEVAEVQRGGGFRRGFLTVMLLVILLAALYIAAPVIAARVPALAGPMAAYVAGVDATRIWLDGLAQSITARLSGLTGGQG
jgi:predicted Zn finger-like uncharacterized protein